MKTLRFIDTKKALPRDGERVLGLSDDGNVNVVTYLSEPYSGTVGTSHWKGKQLVSKEMIAQLIGDRVGPGYIWHFGITAWAPIDVKPKN